MRASKMKRRFGVIRAVLLLVSVGSPLALAGCGDDSGAYRAGYMGTSEYDKVMREAMRTGDTRYIAEEYLPGWEG